MLSASDLDKKEALKESFEDNVFFVDNQETKKNIEKMFKNYGISEGKVYVVEKENYKIPNIQVESETKSLSGFLFTDQIVIKSKIMMNIYLPISFESNASLPVSLMAQ